MDGGRLRRAKFIEWVGEGFDPDADQAEWLTRDVASLAKRWSRKPAKKRAGRR